MNKLYCVIIVILLFTASCRKSDYFVKNEETIQDLGGGTGTVSWTNDKVYILDGFVFVNDGQILTIEPGTVIKAKTGQGSQASALIVARGGKIIAGGTSDKPIIFTVEGDDLEGSVPLKAKGLWGGLILLGNAPVNTPAGEAFIEGIPISEPRGVYGGLLEDDNSGILRYVSIRHGGTKIGEGNEINGLTLGGVGNKTIIEYIEVVANADDGVEFFGGTVNCRNIAVAFCDDDSYDFDDGYTGKCQFLLSIQDDDSDHAAEHSGGVLPRGYNSQLGPEFYNCTYIGSGEEHDAHMISFIENSKAIYKNSVFLNNQNGIAIEFDHNSSSFQQLKNNDLVFARNVFYAVHDNIADSIFNLYPIFGDPGMEKLADYFGQNDNLIDDVGISYNNAPYDLLPVTTAFTGMAEYSSIWYEQVSFKGAFGSNNWLEGWSALWDYGIVE